MIEVRPSKIHGRGVFTTVAILEGAHIGTYEGVKTHINGTHVLWVQEEGEWVGIEGTNDFKYLNHSSDPNCVLYSSLDVYAKRDIKADEELTFNYGAEWSLQKMDYAKLTEDLKEAQRRAIEAIEGVEDGGSCNLDHLILYTGKDPIKRRSKKWVAAIETADCKLGKDRIRGAYSLSLGFTGGFAARRTLAMKTVYDYLRFQGWPVSINYVVD